MHINSTMNGQTPFFVLFAILIVPFINATAETIYDTISFIESFITLVLFNINCAQHLLPNEATLALIKSAKSPGNFTLFFLSFANGVFNDFVLVK